jgi:anti-sigma regulatory factor (Ser/Thr protein kinase)
MSPPVSLIKRVRGLLPVSRETFESERAARLAAEAAGSRLALFADATKALTSSFDLNVVLHDLAHLVAPAFADACLIDLVEPDGSIRRAATAVAPAHEAWAAGLEALHPPSTRHDETAREALRSRRPQVVHEADYSAVAVPLKGRAGTLGVLWLIQASPGAGPATVDLAEELARRASIAVENARLFARQRTVSETLQQSLLPERLPDIPGLTTAARYVPGGPDVDIGGDWYDVMQLPGGGIGLTLGDVVGRGEGAASLMGQLRNAARAYAFEGRSPAEVMDHVNSLLLDAGSEHMATMIYGVLDAETGEFRFANAGHPPPLLVEGRGMSRFLAGGNGPPVGALAAAAYEEASHRLGPGVTLLLYTDGLVERRRKALDCGISRVATVVQDGRTSTLDDLANQIMSDLAPSGGYQDDVVVLLYRHPAPLQLTFPAHVSQLAPARNALRSWLTQAQVAPDQSMDVLIAAGEAVANAIEHGHRNRPDGIISMGATALVDRVHLTITDTGSWKTPQPAADSTRGRGIALMRALMHDVTIDPDAAGTKVQIMARIT